MLQTGTISQKLAAAEEEASRQHQRLQDATHNLDLAAQHSAEGSKQTSMLAKQVALVQSAEAQSHTLTHSIQSLTCDIIASCLLCCTFQCNCSA